MLLWFRSSTDSYVHKELKNKPKQTKNSPWNGKHVAGAARALINSR